MVPPSSRDRFPANFIPALPVVGYFAVSRSGRAGRSPGGRDGNGARVPKSLKQADRQTEPGTHEGIEICATCDLEATLDRPPKQCRGHDSVAQCDEFW